MVSWLPYLWWPPQPHKRQKQLELKSPDRRQRCLRHLVVSAFGLIGPYETGHAPLTRRSNNKAEKKQKASEQGLQMLVWPPFWAGLSRLGAVRPRFIRHTCACLISFPRLTSRNTCLGWEVCAGTRCRGSFWKQKECWWVHTTQRYVQRARFDLCHLDELHTL